MSYKKGDKFLDKKFMLTKEVLRVNLGPQGLDIIDFTDFDTKTSLEVNSLLMNKIWEVIPPKNAKYKVGDTFFSLRLKINVTITSFTYVSNVQDFIYIFDDNGRAIEQDIDSFLNAGEWIKMQVVNLSSTNYSIPTVQNNFQYQVKHVYVNPNASPIDSMKVNIPSHLGAQKVSHEGHEIVANSAGGKEFLFCRKCRVEV